MCGAKSSERAKERERERTKRCYMMMEAKRNENEASVAATEAHAALPLSQCPAAAPTAAERRNEAKRGEKRIENRD